MLLYQARTAAVAGDRKPSAHERKWQLPPPPVERPRTRTGTPPPGKPWDVGTVAGYHEMPREQQEAA
jgi:hypothetical protein